MQDGTGIQRRFRELAAKIATETEHDRSTALVKELNDLLDNGRLDEVKDQSKKLTPNQL